MIRDAIADAACLWCRGPLTYALRAERVRVRVTRGEHADQPGVAVIARCVCGQLTPVLLEVET